MKITGFSTNAPSSSTAMTNPTPAGGDLSGDLPEPTVVGIGNIPVDVTAAADGNVLTYDSGEIIFAPPVAAGLSSISDGITTITPVTDLTVPPHSLSGSTPNADVAWDRLSTVAASGSTETLDLADGDTFDVTLTADCTITLAGATTGRSSAMSVVTRQDGTGGWDITWPGSVSWIGGVAPTPDTTAAAVNVYVLWSFDGGTSWGGTLVGSGSGVTEAEVRDAGRWEVVVSGTAPPVAVSTPGDDDWVYAWVSG